MVAKRRDGRGSGPLKPDGFADVVFLFFWMLGRGEPRGLPCPPVLAAARQRVVQGVGLVWGLKDRGSRGVPGRAVES